MDFSFFEFPAYIYTSIISHCNHYDLPALLHYITILPRPHPCYWTKLMTQNSRHPVLHSDRPYLLASPLRTPYYTYTAPENITTDHIHQPRRRQGSFYHSEDAQGSICMIKFWAYINATLPAHTCTRPRMKTIRIQSLTIKLQQSPSSLIGMEQVSSEYLDRYSF